jgi:hypothetical protein
VKGLLGSAMEKVKDIKKDAFIERRWIEYYPRMSGYDYNS